MATIRKRGLRWQVQIRRKASPQLSRSFTSRSDALAWAREMEVQADRFGLPASLKDLERITVGDLFRRFRDEVVLNTKSAAVDTCIINAFLRLPTASLTLASVTAGAFASYRDERLRVVKPDTVQRELSVFQRAFKAAMVDWGLPLRENPLARVRKPRKRPGRKRRLLRKEEETLRSAISTGMRRCRNPWIAPLFDLALETSCRRSELLRVMWKDVDLDQRTMQLRDTKNGEDRLIALSERAIAVLQELRRPENRLFPISAEAVKCAWRRLRERAGCVDLRFHDLRHEAISRLFERSLTIPEVATMTGHKDIRMLLRYGHAASVRLFAEKLNDPRRDP